MLKIKINKKDIEKETNLKYLFDYDYLLFIIKAINETLKNKKLTKEQKESLSKCMIIFDNIKIK